MAFPRPTIEVLRDGQMRRSCRHCKQKVTFATRADTNRLVPLNGSDPVAIRTSHRSTDWAQTETYDESDVHKCITQGG